MINILVPLDGSELAERALPHARLLATTLQAGLLLVRVVTDREKDILMAGYAANEERLEPEIPWEQRALDELQLSAETYLQRQSNALRAVGLTVHARVCVGVPAEQIVETAAERASICIVMSTHGYSGLRRWALGSVADKVVQSSRTPVLLVRADHATAVEPSELRRVLVPLDGSQLSERALPLAAHLAERAGAQLELLQVVSPVVEAYPYAVVPSSVYETLCDRARSGLQAIADRLQQRSIEVPTVVEIGFPAEAIVDEAHRRQADLIVMATHGRSGLRRWALGSVADRVLHAAKTPLLLVHAPEADPA